jgi:hypothetical protein
VILGDLLQLEGDPRGELIALDAAYLRGSDRATWAQRRAELLNQHLEELQPRTGSSIHYRWHLGFIRRIAMGTSVNFTAIFGHPSLRFVTELVFLEPDLGGFEELLAEACRQTPHLRSLALGDPDRLHPFWQEHSDPLHLYKLVDLTRIEQLFSSDPIEIMDAPALRWLRLGRDADAFARLQRTRLPMLETLAVRNATFSRDAPLDQVSWLLDHPPPMLRELDLPHAVARDLIPRLVDSALLRQLRVLRLWNAGLDRDLARLVTPEAFGHLDLLDLSDPTLDDETIAMLSGACREVITISPWMREVARRPG